jgi:hypothetical protein
MPGPTALFQERILNALEATQAAQEAIQVAQEAIQVSQASQAASDGQGAFSVTYVFALADFGAGFTEDIQGPAGFRGLVKAVDIYEISEAFNGDTTAARLDIGIQAGDADAYVVSADIPDPTGTGAALSLALTAGVVGTIPVGEDILLTGIAPNDAGANTGICTLAVTISYFL